MTCPKCSGLLVPETVHDGALSEDLLRCVNCGRMAKEGEMPKFIDETADEAKLLTILRNHAGLARAISLMDVSERMGYGRDKNGTRKVQEIKRALVELGYPIGSSSASTGGGWMHVFEQMEFAKWLDTKQTEELLRDLETSSTVAFTTENIKGTLSNIFLSRQKLFEQSVWNVFVALTKHFKGNTTGDVGSGDGRSGWKTNDAYKVNARLVFPYGCHYRYGGFDLYNAYRDAGTIYTDLDRVVCNLDGQRFDEILTVCAALRQSFAASHDPGTCESTYFHIRYFKKGTVHLKWKRADLMNRFNITAAAGRNWIGADTQQEAS